MVVMFVNCYVGGGQYFPYYSYHRNPTGQEFFVPAGTLIVVKLLNLSTFLTVQPKTISCRNQKIDITAQLRSNFEAIRLFDTQLEKCTWDVHEGIGFGIEFLIQFSTPLIPFGDREDDASRMGLGILESTL